MNTLMPDERAIFRAAKSRSTQGPSRKERDAIYAALERTLFVSTGVLAASSVPSTGQGAIGAAAGAKHTLSLALVKTIGIAMVKLGPLLVTGTITMASRPVPSEGKTVDHSIPTVSDRAALTTSTSLNPTSIRHSDRPEISTPTLDPVAAPARRRIAVAPSAKPIAETAPTSAPANGSFDTASEALMRARSMWRGGRCEDAIQALDSMGKDSAALREEHAALRVEALACAGRAAEARDEGKRFELTFPKSPYRVAIRRYALANDARP